ncbi:hypothetical protein [Actinomadura fibrosa]|uniref:Uncharacterized protein n=1 Tax=Actinomadura fibrosa TaxID=111802 RepID=A0ABW2XSY2_9ACTN|nr:hypothetical protein [Actinomadura fibrosa]
MTASLAAMLTLWIQHLAKPFTPPERLPIQAVIKPVTDICNGYVIPKDCRQIKPSPDVEEDWTPWLRKEGAIPVSGSEVYIEMQGTTSAAVILTGLHIHVTRLPISTGTFVHASQCGGIDTFRYMEIDLDKSPPAQKAVLNTDLTEEIDPPIQERRPARFPYQVSLEDAETFVLRLVAKSCTCAWTAEINWLSAGKSGSLKVNDHGRALQVTSTGAVRDSCGRIPDRPWKCKPGNAADE